MPRSRPARLAFAAAGMLASLQLAGCAGRAGDPLARYEAPASAAQLGEFAAARPNNGLAQVAYGKALAREGRVDEALRILTSPAALSSRDPGMFAVLGSLYDQRGDFTSARQAYQQGLALERDNAALLNNYAMSYILEGNPAQAEAILRQAIASRAGRDPRLRQNLALAVGLQGRFAEARQIASADLPPADVETNLAYLQRMLQTQDIWRQLRSAG